MIIRNHASMDKLKQLSVGEFETKLVKIVLHQLFTNHMVCLQVFL